MLTILAPLPTIAAKIYLPNPQFGEGEGHTVQVIPKRSWGGTLYTFVKTKNSRRKFSFSIQMSRLKGEEFKRFLLMYHKDQLRLIDHLGRSWDGWITSNPIEFSTTTRGSIMEVEFEFEGTTT